MLIVLGHTECGAVKACLEGVNKGEIGKLIGTMKLESKELDKAVVENIAIQVKRVREMACMKEALKKGALEIYGMLYDLRTGQIKILE